MGDVVSISIKRVDLNTWRGIEAQGRIGIFSSSLWLEAIAKPGLVPMYFVFEDSRTTVGFASGIFQELGPRFFPRIGGAFYLYGGPSMLPGYELVLSECFLGLIARLRKQRCPQVLFRAYDFEHILDFPRLGMLERSRTEFVIPIADESTMWSRMSKSKKVDTKKAVKASLRLKISLESQDVEILEQCMEATTARKQAKGLDFSPYIYDFLDKDVIKSLVNSGLARIPMVLNSADIPLAASLFLAKGKGSFLLLAGVRTEGLEVGAYAFLHWELFRHLFQNGVEYCNLGGVPSGEQGEKLAFFKKLLGAEPRRRSACVSRLWGLGPRELVLHAVSPNLLDKLSERKTHDR